MVMRQVYQDFISREDIRFWIPLLVFAIGLASSYFGLKNDIRALTDELKYHIERADIFESRVASLTTAINSIEKDVTILNNIHGR